ncbi:plant U-box 45 [Actinidia rufa]|uniref:Plant U-box 45 n=1 Tax=Actinidia rufa TaxID=165716 RepID=A0A7J0FX73_9ERIC|nr:plant U-box 45 [Actinidia rufa]
MMLAAGVLPLLEEMVAKSNSHGSVTAFYLNLSCLEEAKPVIDSSEVVPFLISLLRDETDPQCKLDALHTLFNLSSHPFNIPPLLSAGIINGLLSLVTDSSDHTWTEKSVAIFINLASNNQMVLQEGVIPSLVSMSVNGTIRGKQIAQKLLMLFREQCQRDPSPVRTCQDPKRSDLAGVDSGSIPLSKSISTRKVGRAWSFWWKNKSFFGILVVRFCPRAIPGL